MPKETILVVSNGEVDALHELVKSCGCEVIKARIDTATRLARKFIGEFDHGISVAIVQGLCPDDAHGFAGQLKDVYEHMHVLVLSEQVTEPIREEGRMYDIISPPRREHVRNMLETFIGFQEF